MRGQMRNKEESGLETRGLIDHIGRSDAGNFHLGSYSYLAHIKQEERAKVAEFILGYFPGIGPKILTMPGISWAFEIALINARPMTHVVGIENSATVYYRAARAMPMLCLQRLHARNRDFAVMSERMRQYGRSSYTYARTTANQSSKKTRSAHRLLLMKMSTFASMLVSDYGQTKQQIVDFHHRFCSRTAAWLDFTGSISKEIENSLRFLPFCLEAPHISSAKPVVITLFNGHDHFRGVEQRIAHLVQAQPLFKPIKHWTYAGKNGSSMLTVCGEIL